MEFGDVAGLAIVCALLGVIFLSIFHRFFSFREKQLEVQANSAAEKAAQYAAHTSELERRVRVLEQIVTDRGADTAAQIEALRAPRVSQESRTV